MICFPSLGDRGKSFFSGMKTFLHYKDKGAYFSARRRLGGALYA